MMEILAKIVNEQKKLTIFSESFIIDDWKGLKYASTWEFRFHQ